MRMLDGPTLHGGRLAVDYHPGPLHNTFAEIPPWFRASIVRTPNHNDGGFPEPLPGPSTIPSHPQTDNEARTAKESPRACQMKAMNSVGCVTHVALSVRHVVHVRDLEATHLLCLHRWMVQSGDADDTVHMNLQQ